MDITNLYQKTETIKKNLLQTIVDLKVLQQGNNAVSCNEDFKHAETLLKKKDFDVVVCGEVKQGKTSFINALLGKSLLPTAVKVATSQVFRITNSSKEEFFLVFDDGSKQEINKEDMIRYGTESGEVLINDPLLRGRSLRWIDVYTPARFLPEGIHLIDTPGLGALFCRHAEITHKYIAGADAVIFVKSCKDPLVDQERDFLKKIFSVTSNVLLLQSKIDLLGEEEQQIMLNRNEELMNKEFGGVAGKKFRFWPISSANLALAGDVQDEESCSLLKNASRFDEMLDALKVLFFRTSGYLGASVAYEVSFSAYKTMENFALEQKKMLTAISIEEKQKLRRAKQAKSLEFNVKWGLNGTELKKINGEISKVLKLGRERVQGIFALGGEVRNYFSEEIKNLPNDSDCIANYAKLLPDRIIESVSSQLKSIGRSTQNDLENIIKKFKVELAKSSQSDINLSINTNIKLTESTLYSKSRDVFTGASMGTTLGWVATIGLASIGVLATGGIAGVLIPAAVGLFSGWLGLGEAKRRKIEQDKNTLQSYSEKMITELNTSFTKLLLGSDQSKLDQIFNDLRNNVEQACKDLVQREQSRLDSELVELDRQASLNIEQSEKQLEKVQALRKQLSSIKESLIKEHDNLEAINQEINF